MANLKVSEMTEATMFDDNDYTMIVQANQSKKISKENMLGGIETNIGDLSTLTTPVVSNLVGAINSVVESGSNANGNYIKYADGTMICTKKVSYMGLQFTNVWGYAYESSSVNLGDYAQEFVEIPVMFISCVASTAAPEGLSNTKTSYGNVTFYRPIRTDVATYNYTFYLMAIGKWK